MSGLHALLDLLPPWMLVGGKGGVGKTTCAAALALQSATRGAHTLLLSTDPAGALGDALGAPLSGTPGAVPGEPQLDAMQLDPAAARDAFLTRWRGVLVTILDRGTYLDRDDVTGLVDAALPGLDETMALLTLLDLERGDWTRLVLDTAPTGHALRLLELPRSFRTLLALLDAMQDKHRFMVRALTHRDQRDEADRFLDDMRSRVETLQRTLTDRARFGAVLVARAERLVAEETARYAAALDELGIALRAIIINALPTGPATGETAAALDALVQIDPAVALFHVPLLDRAPVGIAGVRQWGMAVRTGPVAGRAEHGAARTTRRREATRKERAKSRRVAAHPPVRPLTIVGGKGGVGKTTVACALGVLTASPAAPVLVVSTDPAPSVADALDQLIGEEPVPVAGAPGLVAQQLDAEAAFARLRERYAARVDAMFDSILGGSLDTSYDRRIARDLFSLAPPGIDELHALATLGETLATGRFSAVIVDPAPTGHLLRLLELPDVAVDWSHRLLRLMLKYKEVVGLGEAAEDVLAFARRTRALVALLRDPARAGVLAVALDEPLVRTETERLIRQVRALGIDVLGLLWNRVTESPSPLPTARDVAQFEAATIAPPPRGVDALARWARTWRISR